MIRKHEVRQLAMQVLYAWDASQEPSAASAEHIVNTADASDETRRAAVVMAQGTWDQRETIDQRIERIAPQWPTRRQPLVDRNILRLAAWELINSDTPPKVVLDEAIELAKEFSTKDSPAFINGVMDAVLKDHQKLTAALPPLPSGEGRGEGATE